MNFFFRASFIESLIIFLLLSSLTFLIGLYSLKFFCGASRKDEHDIILAPFANTIATVWAFSGTVAKFK